VAEHFPVTRREFRNLIIAGFKGSFFGRPYNAKRAYVRRAIELYDRWSGRMLQRDHCRLPRSGTAA
jgi:hypothetical protein